MRQRFGKSLKCGEGGFGGSDNSKTVYEIEKKLGWCNHKLIFLVHQPSFFFIFDDILEILLPPVKQKTLYFNFIMVFSRGQNGKGFEKIKQIGKLKKNGFSNRKLGTKNKKHPSFNKERLIVPNALRKRVTVSHHHELRSPQKRAKPNNFAQIEAAAEVVVPHIDVYPADAEPFAEPFSELMPRELRTSKGASAQYVPVITARRLQPNEVPHDDFGTVNNKPL